MTAEPRRYTKPEDFDDAFYSNLARLMQNPKPEATAEINRIYDEVYNLYTLNGWKELPGWSDSANKPINASDSAQSSSQSASAIAAATSSPDPSNRVKQRQERPLAPTKRNAAGLTQSPNNSPRSLKKETTDVSQPDAQQQQPVIKKKNQSSSEDGNKLETCSKCRTAYHEQCQIKSEPIKSEPEPILSAASTDFVCASCKTSSGSQQATAVPPVIQKCHDPVIKSSQMNDPRFIFTCMFCSAARKATVANTTQARPQSIDLKSESQSKNPSAPKDVASMASEFLAKHKAMRKSPNTVGPSGSSTKATTPTSQNAGAAIGLSKLAQQSKQHAAAAANANAAPPAPSTTKSRAPPTSQSVGSVAASSTSMADAQKRLAAMQKKARAKQAMLK